jgi:hypothetical protein
VVLKVSSACGLYAALFSNLRGQFVAGVLEGVCVCVCARGVCV